MKKIIPVFLVVLILLLSACGTNSGNNSAVNAGNNVASGEADAEPVNNEADEESTQPQEPKYELSDYTIYDTGVFIRCYYWLTNTGDIPLEIKDFSADMFDKDGVHICDSYMEEFQEAPVLPGKKVPILFLVNESKAKDAEITIEKINKIVPEVHVKASDKLLSDVPFSFKQPEKDESVDSITIVENNTDEKIRVVVLINRFDPDGTLIGFGEKEKNIEPGYKEPIKTSVTFCAVGLRADDSKYDVSVYRITENPDMTSYEY